jgi:hypothetical protein
LSSTKPLNAQANVCGVAIPAQIQKTRLHVESYYKHPIECQLEAGEGGEAELGSRGPILHLGGGEVADRKAMTYHELMHMQLWTEGFAPDDSSCPDAPYAFDPGEREHLCHSLRELLCHRLIADRLGTYGLNESSAYSRVILKAAQSLDTDLKAARQHGRTSLKVYLDLKAVLLLDGQYRSPGGIGPMVEEYRRIHLEKAINLAAKLKQIIDRENPLKPEQFGSTIGSCLSVIAQGGFIGHSEIPVAIHPRSFSRAGTITVMYAAR